LSILFSLYILVIYSKPECQHPNDPLYILVYTVFWLRILNTSGLTLLRKPITLAVMIPSIIIIGIWVTTMALAATIKEPPVKTKAVPTNKPDRNTETAPAKKAPKMANFGFSPLTAGAKI